MSDLATLIERVTAPVTPENEADHEAAAITLGEQGAAALPAIQRLLQAADTDVRFWAVRSLWANGSTAAQETLIADLLSDQEEMVRSGAAFALGELQSEISISALIRLLMEDPGAPGDYAAHALSKIGQPAAEPLIDALKDKRTLVRIRAAKALTPIKSHAAIRQLIHCFDHDPSYLVRHHADEALKRMGVGEMVYFR